MANFKTVVLCFWRTLNLSAFCPPERQVAAESDWTASCAPSALSHTTILFAYCTTLLNKSNQRQRWWNTYIKEWAIKAWRRSKISKTYIYGETPLLVTWLRSSGKKAEGKRREKGRNQNLSGSKRILENGSKSTTTTLSKTQTQATKTKVNCPYSYTVATKCSAKSQWIKMEAKGKEHEDWWWNRPEIPTKKRKACRPADADRKQKCTAWRKRKGPIKDRPEGKKRQRYQAETNKRIKEDMKKIYWETKQHTNALRLEEKDMDTGREEKGVAVQQEPGSKLSNKQCNCKTPQRRHCQTLKEHAWLLRLLLPIQGGCFFKY